MVSGNPPIYLGRESTVKITDAIDTIDNSKTLEAFVEEQSTVDDVSGQITEITITDPEAGVDIQNTFGGQVRTESPFDLVQVDFTMRFDDLNMIENLHGSATTTTGSFTRISGKATIGNRPDKAILFRLAKPAVDSPETPVEEHESDYYIIYYLINNAWFTQMGEVSLSGDGTAEITGSAVALAEDKYVERNF